MENLTLRGRAWIFGDDVDTDVITPGQYMHLPAEELSQHVFEPIAPEFAGSFEAGGVLIAGSNFGCGSSRETAPLALKHLGVAAVVAASFGRIFFRSAVAIGLPVLVCPGVASEVEDGDEVEVDLGAARVVNRTRGGEISGAPLHEMIVETLRRGGLMKLLATGAAMPGANEPRRGPATNGRGDGG